MAIIQISKIQQRSGNLVDLPQLDNAEFGWASDQKLLFIGKTSPNENVEVLTSYSHISFSQIDGSVGNLSITPANLPGGVANGQVLAFDGTNWVNKGGNAGGLIDLGSNANVKISGGALDYVLTTDGLGNLSWSSKGTISSYIENVSQANPGVVTTVENNLFTDGLKVTITDARGMTDLNGNSYYVDVLTSNTFALYQDANLATPVNTTSYNVYAYTNVANTFSNNAIKVGNSSPFTLNYPIKFLGNISSNGTANTNLSNTTTYYVKTKPSSTTITVSDELLANGTAGNVVVLNNVNGLTANVYETGGRILCTLVSSGGTSSVAAGATTQVQYNAGGVLGASSSFTFDNTSKLMTVGGNANVGNLNASGTVTTTRLISNIAIGTAPIQVTSTTLVPNLYVARANVGDYSVVTAQNTGTYYPVFASGSSTANYALAANSAVNVNLATGVLTAGGFTTSGNIAANNVSISNIANVGANLNVTGNLSVTANANVTGNLNVTANANIVANLSANNVSISNIANVGANLNVAGNITAPRLISNIVTGTAPLTVTSTTRVSNLNVAYANVTDYSVVTAQTTGTYYPVLINGSSSANYALSANSLISVAVDTGVLAANGFTTSGNITANNVSISNIANVGANLNVTGNTSLLSKLSVVGNVTMTGSNVSLGPIGNVKITGGTNGYVVSTDGTGNLSFVNPGAITSSPAGSNTQVQFNDNGILGATAGLTFTKTSNSLIAIGNITGGNLTTAGILSVTGNASTGNISATNANVTAITASGNANVGNLGTTGLITATGTVTGGNLSTAGTLNVTGNANVGNLGTNALVALGNVTLSGANISLGGIGNVKITGGTSGYVLVTDGSGNLNFANPGAIGTQPAGSNTQVQFNDAGTLGATANFTFTKTNGDVYLAGNLTSGKTINGANLVVTGTGNINGNINAGANINVVLSANIGGALDVSGVTTLKSGVGVTGNVTASGVFYGNGSGLSQLTGANVIGAVASATTATTATSATTAATVTTNAQPNITSVGTLTGLGVNGNITAANIIANTGVIYGNGSGLSAITGANVIGAVASATTATTATSATTAGTVTTAAQPNITSVSSSFGNLTFAVNNSITMSGANANISGANLISGTYLAGTLTTAAQPNITSVSTSFGNLTFAANNKITMSGSLSQLTGANLVSASYLTGTLTTAAQPNITSVGTLTGLTVSGSLSAINITATSGVITGDGSGLNNIQAGNVVGKVANAVYADVAGSSGPAISAATVTNNAQPNITSVGTLTSLGVSGNITAANIIANTGVFYGNGSGLYALNGSNVTGTVSSASTATTATSATTAATVTTAAQPNITSVSTSFGNLTFAANNSITMSGANANISGANLVSANYISGNGALLGALNATNITNGTLSQARLANSSLTINGTSISLGSSASITANTTQTLTLGSYLTGTSFNGGTAVTAAVDATTTNTASKVVARDASGNFAANVITATLSGAATTAGTVTTVAQPNITSVGILTSLTTSGDINISTSNYPYLRLNTTSATNKRAGVSFAQNSTAQYDLGTDVSSNNDRNFYIYDSVSAATRFYIDSAGNVAIGGGTPVSKLDVYNSSGYTDIRVRSGSTQAFMAADTSAITMGTYNNVPYLFSSNNIERMRIDTAGNVGIGTSSPSYKLDVAGDIRTTGVFYGNGSGLSAITGANVTGTVASATSATTAGTITTNAQPNITSVGTLTALAVSGTTGISSTDSSGTAGATKILKAVNGAFDLAFIPRTAPGSYNSLVSTDDALITFANTSAIGNGSLTIAPWATATSGIRIQSVSNIATIFLNATNTNVSAALNVSGIITGNGNGISSIQGSNVTGTVANATYATSAGSATTAGTVTTAAQPNITSLGTLSSLAVTGNITAGGNVGIGTNSPGYLFDVNGSARIVTSLGVGTAPSGTAGEIRATNNITAYYSSDIKFKENVKPIENALDKVLAIGGNTFDWKDDYIKEHGGEDGYFVRKNDFGVVAQDVQSVFPLAVREREDGTLAVDYEKLAALAFQAIKEQQEIIQTQNDKMVSLEQKLDQLLTLLNYNNKGNT